MFARKEIDFIAKLVYKKEGGRTSPTYSGYRPHIEFEGIPERPTSGQQVFKYKKKVCPGDTVIAEITILSHQYMEGKLFEGQKFIFCEGSVKIGDGVINEIINKKLYKQREERQQ